MNLFKKIITKHREQTELPEAMGWDDMSEGIYDKLDQIGNASDAKNPYRENRLKWLLLLLLLMAGVWSCNEWLKLKSDDGLKLDKNLQYAQEDISVPVPQTTEQNDNKEVDHSEVVVSTSIMKDQKEAQDLEPQKRSVTIGAKEVNNAQSIVEFTDLQSVPKVTTTNQSDSHHFDSFQFLSADETQTIESSNLYRLNQIPIIPFEIIHPAHFLSSIPDLAELNDVDDDQVIGNPWQVSMLSGTSLGMPIDRVLSDDPGLVISETSIPSFSFGGGASFKVSSSLFLEGMLSYSKFYTRYDLTEIRTIPIVLENQVVEIRTNPLSGRSRSILGSVPTTLVETRKFRKYNSVGILNLSLRAGWESQFNKFGTRLYAGLTASRAISASGKAYVDREIVEYSQFLDRYQSSTQLGINTGLRVSYDLSTLINIGIDLVYNHYMIGNTSIDIQRFDPTNVSAGFSIGYRL